MISSFLGRRPSREGGRSELSRRWVLEYCAVTSHLFNGLDDCKDSAQFKHKDFLIDHEIEKATRLSSLLMRLGKSTNRNHFRVACLASRR